MYLLAPQTGVGDCCCYYYYYYSHCYYYFCFCWAAKVRKLNEVAESNSNIARRFTTDSLNVCHRQTQSDDDNICAGDDDSFGWIHGLYNITVA